MFKGKTGFEKKQNKNTYLGKKNNLFFKCENQVKECFV